MAGCCNKVLQCNNPPGGLVKLGKPVDLKCPTSEPSPHPHFGDIKLYSGEGVM